MNRDATINLLVIEDNQDDLFFIKKALSDKRYQITHLSDGMQAYHYLLQPSQVHDVILLDNLLPGMNGLEIIEGLRQKGLDYSIIFLTVDKTIETVVKVMRAGALDFIIKSAGLKNELPEKIGKVYEIHRARIEKKQLESAFNRMQVILGEQRDVYRTLLFASLDGYCVCDTGGRFLEVNEKFSRMSGFTIKALLSMHLWEIEAEASKEEVLHHLQRIALGGEDRFETRYRCRDGSLIYVENSVKYLKHNGSGKFLAFVRDITERKQYLAEILRARDHAEKSDRLKTAFLQNMSHEIRTPMNAIMGFAQLLPGCFDNKEKLTQFTNIISQRSSDLMDIINDILDFSQIESGQLSMNPVSFTLSDLFRELIGFMKEQKLRKANDQVRFLVRLPHPIRSRSCFTDKGKLKQVFVNLISNACKFTDKGEIEVGCIQEESGLLQFYVADTGIGIPADKQDFIFERFAQIPRSDQKLSSGTGLGLPIVKGLLGLLDGTIRVKSEPGKGAAFYFTIRNIPFEQLNLPTLEKENSRTSLIQKGSGKSVLVVEDEYFNRELIKEWLTPLDLMISYAQTGQEALEAVRNQSFDLILMDIGLPDMSGYEVIRQVKALDPSLKIIAQTAYASGNDRLTAMNSGCVDYISKPFNEEAFSQLVLRHL